MSDSNLKLIRFRQRLENLKKAFSFFEVTLSAKADENVKNAAIIKAFEMVFELSWKTLKDYLEYQGIVVSSPREVLKESFQQGLLINGQKWIDLLDQRNQLVHLYDEIQARASVSVICDIAFPEARLLLESLTTRSGS